MDKQLLIFLLIAHVMADFHFQSHRMAAKKQESVAAFILHGLFVFLLNGLIILMYGQITVLIHLAFISAAHLLIDFAKGRLSKKRQVAKRHELLLFWLDQGIHILIILAVLLRIGPVSPGPWANGLRHILSFTGLAHVQGALAGQDSLYLLSKLILAFLLLTKPANLIIAISTKQYHYEDNMTSDMDIDDMPGDMKSTESVNLPLRGRVGAGALIGSLERILSAILLAGGQIAAIGLIFTAKSIARFDRIQKDQRFAEYYLIGSLSSMLICVLVVTALIYLL